MRKQVIPIQHRAPITEPVWLDLEQLAEVEITSEDPDHPIESALTGDLNGPGWRAATPGEQCLRLYFAHPLRLKTIRLSFSEQVVQRAQEYVLRWSSDSGQTFTDIVRQQWNFNPENADSEIEEHKIELADVTAIELSIIPDMTGRRATASLQSLRLA